MLVIGLEENVVERFSKAIGNYYRYKSDYLKLNSERLAVQKRIVDSYRSQPKRTHCKLCAKRLSNTEKYFLKNKIRYLICLNCGHLNGEFKDTMNFVESLYTNNENDVYSSEYIDESQKYNERVNEIYLPKAEFLKDALSEEIAFEDVLQMKIADFGAGAGHFVAALQDIGFQEVEGYEVSEKLVEYGNSHLKNGSLRILPIASATEKLMDIDVDIVSLIFVLEHLEDPRQAFENIANNPSISYFYFSVPLFSLSVVFETIFENNMQRVLTEGHTHLFTQNSIQTICREFQFAILAEWWFGLDIADLSRNIQIILDQRDCPGISDYFRQKSRELVDALQQIIDRKKLCSEVHVLVKKTGHLSK